jgi:hypothetical protein
MGGGVVKVKRTVLCQGRLVLVAILQPQPLNGGSLHSLHQRLDTLHVACNLRVIHPHAAERALCKVEVDFCGWPALVEALFDALEVKDCRTQRQRQGQRHTQTHTNTHTHRHTRAHTHTHTRTDTGKDTQENTSCSAEGCVGMFGSNLISVRGCE